MEKLNLVEILKDCPQGMELDCTICDNPVILEGVIGDNNPYPIRVKSKGFHHVLTRYGSIYDYEDAKCVIFPKGKTTWEGFVPPCKSKKESEDEKIRKELTEYLKSASGGFLNSAIQCKTFRKWYTWLEKQDIPSKKDVDDAYLKGVTDTKNEIEKQYEADYQIRKDIATFLFNYKGDGKDKAKWMNYLGVKVSFIEMPNEKPHTIK